MKILMLGAVCAVGLLFNTGCKSCDSCSKPAMKCDGGCCKDAATCAACCKDAAGCAKCCKK